MVNISTQGTIKQTQRSPNPLLDDPFFRRFFDLPELGPRKFQSAGSGVIFDAKNGYIVTNAHVIENASEITVTLQDGHDLKAEIVGTDTASDVAVLKVKSDKLVAGGAGATRRRWKSAISSSPSATRLGCAHRYVGNRQWPVPLRHHGRRL